MRKYTLIASTLVSLIAIPAAANAASSFLFGMVVGSMMSSGGGHSNGVDASVIYTADEETMKAVDPFSVRQINISNCFSPAYGSRADGKTLKEIFTVAIKDLPPKERTILQILRIIEPNNISCATTWFSYVEKQ